MMTAREIVKALGGDWFGDYGLVPGPGHSTRDRSVRIKDDARKADGIAVHSFAGDGWRGTDAPIAVKDDHAASFTDWEPL